MRFFGTMVGKGVKLYAAPKVIGFYSKICIGDYAVLNEGVVLNSRGKIRIGRKTHLSSFCKIYTGQLDLNNRSVHKESDVIIGNNVWIGSAAIILGGVEICDNTVIAAGSVVTKSIDKSGLYAGVPAKYIRGL